jgi:hypothetical protein
MTLFFCGGRFFIVIKKVYKKQNQVSFHQLSFLQKMQIIIIISGKISLRSIIFDLKGYIYVYAKKKMHESLPDHYALYDGGGWRSVYGG